MRRTLFPLACVESTVHICLRPFAMRSPIQADLSRIDAAVRGQHLVHMPQHQEISWFGVFQLDNLLILLCLCEHLLLAPSVRQAPWSHADSIARTNVARTLVPGAQCGSSLGFQCRNILLLVCGEFHGIHVKWQRCLERLVRPLCVARLLFEAGNVRFALGWWSKADGLGQANIFRWTRGVTQQAGISSEQRPLLTLLTVVGRFGRPL
mmetsp:Transcript_88597/g.156379  ORF Transcript_88597/g.156379 Transcript_88597/m.156379 type:complete len:208 (-) Transcript_88597:196-819(-)